MNDAVVDLKLPCSRLALSKSFGKARSIIRDECVEKSMFRMAAAHRAGQNPTGGSIPSTSTGFSPVTGFHAQLPVRLSLCASAKYVSLSRSVFSVLHCCGDVRYRTPRFRRRPGDVLSARAKTWRCLTLSSGIRRRCSISTSVPSVVARCIVWRARSRSSG